mmetsp:Transcript_42156/g.78459  ORF Transcript_42156/g.78459 Transcript_42156/m.78459 type:complete len:588 (-) Transcript_42156:112-1875(-)
MEEKKSPADEKGRQSDLIPGIFSCVGRQTDRGMDKLRQAVREVVAVNRLAEPAKRADSAGGEPGARPPPTDKSTSVGRALRERMGLTGGQAGTNAGLLVGLDDEEEHTSEVVVESPTKSKPTIHFTGASKDEDVFNETARTHLNRFFRQSQTAKNDPGPPIGRYRPQYKLVSKRVPQTDIKATLGKHPSRKIPERLNDSGELGPINQESLDFRFASTSSSSPSYNGSRPKVYEQMSLSTKRPPLNKLCHIRMTEITEPAENKDRQDILTSNIIRQPEWNFETPKGRGDVIITSYYEAGKYNNKYDLVQASPKKSPAFHQKLGRSATTGSIPKGGRAAPPMMMEASNAKGTANHPDRSLFRSAPAANKRVTHVMHFEKDLKRPPLINAQPVYHDEDNPDHCAVIHERAMAFDASTVDRAVTGRRDIGPHMGKTISRHRAGRGSRISQNDISYRHMLGHTGFETTGQMECSVEESKEAPSRLRSDLGTTFEQSVARATTRTPTSPLRRPREALAPEFARMPQQYGLDVRTPVTVVPRDRTHDPLPGWNAETLQELEMQMEADDKYMRARHASASSAAAYQDAGLVDVAS